MNHIEKVEKEILELRNELTQHHVYELLSDVDDIRVFMEKHVYAVWDFMSLLKALQNKLTCVTLPWKPVNNPKLARFINEIVHGEESDINENNEPRSHYEMYLEAMEEVGADTLRVENFVNSFTSLANYQSVLADAKLNPAEQSFLNFTFKTIQSNASHKIASAFTFGREDLIPDMFLQIIDGSKNGGQGRFPKLKYYLERHIEVDGDEHGPLSLEMIQELCGDDEQKWIEVIETAKEALRQRINLWDEIAKEIKHKAVAVAAM